MDTGALVASCVVALWTVMFYICLFCLKLDATPFWRLATAFMLMTFLFITAHDAMHGNVSVNRTVNDTFGYVGCLMYAGMWLRPGS